MSKKNKFTLFSKMTKIGLFIFCPTILLIFFICLGLSVGLKNWSFVFAFLVSLLPILLFVFLSLFLPIERIFAYGSKKMIVLWVIIYIIKYAIIFTIPIVCFIFAKNIFDKWVMLTMAVLAPTAVFIMKIIFTFLANKDKKDKQNQINTIKF